MRVWIHECYVIMYSFAHISWYGSRGWSWDRAVKQFSIVVISLILYKQTSTMVVSTIMLSVLLGGEYYKSVPSCLISKL